MLIRHVYTLTYMFSLYMALLHRFLHIIIEHWAHSSYFLFTSFIDLAFILVHVIDQSETGFFIVVVWKSVFTSCLDFYFEQQRGWQSFLSLFRLPCLSFLGSVSALELFCGSVCLLFMLLDIGYSLDDCHVILYNYLVYLL